MQRFPPVRNPWLALQNGEISEGSWLSGNSMQEQLSASDDQLGETITMVTKATTPSGLPATRRQSEHRFFVWLAIAIALLVFVGFSRTYYFHTFFRTPKLTMFLHVYAAVMTRDGRCCRWGDMAVYRGTYNEDNGSDGVLMTHRT